MSLSDVDEAARRQGLGVLIGAPLADFPPGTYGYYCGEFAYLDDLDLDLDAPAEDDPDTDLLVQIWDGVDATLLDRVRAQAADVAGVWIGDQGDIWATEVGLAHIHDLFDDADPYALSCYVYQRSSEATVFDAIDSLVYTPIVSMESAWGELDPDEYGVDDETEALLDQVDDPRVQAALQVVLGNDATVFEKWATPAELATKTRGVHVVCELEDQCQQDFVNRVLYIPPRGLHRA